MKKPCHGHGPVIAEGILSLNKYGSQPERLFENIVIDKLNHVPAKGYNQDNPQEDFTRNCFKSSHIGYKCGNNKAYTHHHKGGHKCKSKACKMIYCLKPYENQSYA